VVDDDGTSGARPWKRTVTGNPTAHTAHSTQPTAMYLLGVNLPDNKRVSVALKSFYGIGERTAVAITHRLLIHPACKLGHLSTPQLSALSVLLNGMVLEADARREVKSSIAKYVESGSYRGSRHLKGYPANGGCRWCGWCGGGALVLTCYCCCCCWSAGLASGI
jgi:small subunit ribosomal protein S13